MTNFALSRPSLAQAPSLTTIRAELRKRALERQREELRTNETAIRARCSTLAGFIKEAWPILEPGAVYRHGWHIEAICQHLEAITYGHFLAKGLENRLLINIPPGTMKSLIVGVFWPAWEWGPAGQAHLRYLTTSYSEFYAKRDARRMRYLVDSEWYRSLWPQIVTTGGGEVRFVNSARGSREAMPFVSLTGGRGDRLIIDDPHSTEMAESDADRARTTRIFRESVPSRINDPVTSAIVVIMQRLHADDVSGQIERLGLGYTRLVLPMEFERDRRCRTGLGFVDPRRDEGELLFPDRFPRQTVERDKAAMGPYAVAGQYQQRPIPRDGGLFKRHWFSVVDAAPAGCRWVRAWDLAATETTQASAGAFTAGVLMGRTPDGRYIVADSRRERLSPAGVDRMIRATAEQDGRAVSISLPQDPGQAGKAQAQYLVKMLAGFRVKASPETGDKITRAEPFAAQAEAGNVSLLRGPWNDMWLDEVCMFPGGSFKDQVDASSRSFAELALGSSYTLANVG